MRIKITTRTSMTSTSGVMLMSPSVRAGGALQSTKRHGVRPLAAARRSPEWGGPAACRRSTAVRADPGKASKSASMRPTRRPRAL